MNEANLTTYELFASLLERDPSFLYVPLSYVPYTPVDLTKSVLGIKNIVSNSAFYHVPATITDVPCRPPSFYTPSVVQVTPNVQVMQVLQESVMNAFKLYSWSLTNLRNERGLACALDRLVDHRGGVLVAVQGYPLLLLIEWAAGTPVVRTQVWMENLYAPKPAEQTVWAVGNLAQLNAQVAQAAAGAGAAGAGAAGAGAGTGALATIGAVISEWRRILGR